MESGIHRRSDPVVAVRQRRSFTLFDLVEWICPAFGLGVGMSFGWNRFGAIGAVLGAVAGGLGGLVLGRLPLFLALRLLGLRRKSTAGLQAIFEKDQYYVFHLALPELMARGVDVSPQRPRILDLLLSKDSDRRSFGWTCLQIAFPELARGLAGFDPRNPSAEHLVTIGRLRELK